MFFKKNGNLIMPRSSRHKSSKHGARDSREYSESEDDLGVKERKGGNEEDGGSVRVSKDSVSSEKRKLDSKESRRDDYAGGSRNGEFSEDYGNSSSRTRKERGSGDGVSDRWNGGRENFDKRSEGFKKARGSLDLKSSSRRREDEVEDAKRSCGRSEKHSSRELSRKEGKDKEREKDRDRYREKDKERDKERERGGEKKRKGGKGDKFGDNEDVRPSSKQEITTDPKADLHVRKSDPDDVLERRNRKRSENIADVYQDENGDVKNKHTSSADDVVKVIRKDEKHGDEKYREKYRDETEKSRQDKYKDGYTMKDCSRSRSREKYSTDGKDYKDVKQKRMKLADGDPENDFHSGFDHSQCRDQDQERDGGSEHDGYWKRDQVSGCERDWDSDREQERDHAHDQEPDMGLYDEMGSRSRDRRGRKLSPDDHDNYDDSKVKGSKALHTDLDNVSLGSSRVEAETRGDGTCSRPAYVDISPNNYRSRVSPTSSSHDGDDGSRHARQEDSKYRELQMESRPKTSSDKTAERSSIYRSSEKHIKADDGHIELTSERSASSKPSPMGLTDGSSSPSLDRRYMNRSGVRRSLDVEDAGRRRGASAGSRDFSVAEGKSGRDIDVYKSMVEEPSRGDSSFNKRQGQGNANPPPPFRRGVESPTFMGMMEEDSRPNSSSRYKRMGDPGMGRGHMNSWRGVPNWSLPLPNGFMPFQSGPPHRNFQSILPQFPSPHIFSVRPPMEINQPGLPFPLADTDRFPGHLRPLGWPNMIDPSVTSRLHGWDVNNGVMRDESHLFGPDWEHNRHPITAREWESNVDVWKGHNSVSADVPSATNRDSTRAQFPTEDDFLGQGNHKSHNENSHEASELKSTENRPALTPEKRTPILSSEICTDKKQISAKAVEIDSVLCISQFYLSRLDISEQLAHPEVYKQCIDLLDGKPGLTVANDPAVLMILTNDRRNGHRTSDNSLSSSVLPSTDDFTFQKALELYKSQGLEMRDIEMVKVGPPDSILPTNSNQRGVGVPTESEEKHSLEMDEDERLQSPHWTSDQDKIIDGADTVKDDLVDEPSLESNNATLQELQTEVVEKREISSTYPADHAASSNGIIPQATSAEVDASLAVQARVDGIAAKFEISSGKVGNDSVVVGDLSVACEVVSNESELDNFGRIHHHHHSSGSTQ